MRPTFVRRLHFKLKGFHDGNLLNKARLQIKARAVEKPQTWYKALELSPPRPVPPNIQGKMKRLKVIKSPSVFLGEKALTYMRSTQQGRDLVRGFGGEDHFEKNFVEQQMELIKSGKSEKEAFDTVKQSMEEKLETYRTNMEEAYATIVEADGGKSLSEFVAAFTPKARLSNKTTHLPGSSLRAGPKEIAFMRALDELGFVGAMKKERKEAKDTFKKHE
jgi:hypothetical protein